MATTTWYHFPQIPDGNTAWGDTQRNEQIEAIDHQIHERYTETAALRLDYDTHAADTTIHYAMGDIHIEYLFGVDDRATYDKFNNLFNGACIDYSPGDLGHTHHFQELYELYGSTDITIANLTTLTTGGLADGLHTHSVSLQSCYDVDRVIQLGPDEPIVLDGYNDDGYGYSTDVVLCADGYIQARKIEAYELNTSLSFEDKDVTAITLYELANPDGTASLTFTIGVGDVGCSGKHIYVDGCDDGYGNKPYLSYVYNSGYGEYMWHYNNTGNPADIHVIGEGGSGTGFHDHKHNSSGLEGGLLRHDDIQEVYPDQHHNKLHDLDDVTAHSGLLNANQIRPGTFNDTGYTYTFPWDLVVTRNFTVNGITYLGGGYGLPGAGCTVDANGNISTDGSLTVGSSGALPRLTITNPSHTQLSSNKDLVAYVSTNRFIVAESSDLSLMGRIDLGFVSHIPQIQFYSGGVEQYAIRRTSGYLQLVACVNNSNGFRFLTTYSSAELPRLTITNQGAVTITPSLPLPPAVYSLDVYGNLHASGTLVSGSTITIDGSPAGGSIVSSTGLELSTSAGDLTLIPFAAVKILNAPFQIRDAGDTADYVFIGALSDKRIYAPDYAIQTRTANFTTSAEIGTVGSIATNLTVRGGVSISHNLAINTTKFTVDGISGNTVVGGMLTVTNAATLNSTLGVAGNLKVNVNKFMITASTGSAETAGDIIVHGSIVCDNDLGVGTVLANSVEVATSLAVSGTATIATSLGIANLSPTYPLDVTGAIRSTTYVYSDNFYINGVGTGKELSIYADTPGGVEGARIVLRASGYGTTAGSIYLDYGYSPGGPLANAVLELRPNKDSSYGVKLDNRGVLTCRNGVAFQASAAPASPINGTVYFNGTNLMIWISALSAWKTISWV